MIFLDEIEKILHSINLAKRNNGSIIEFFETRWHVFRDDTDVVYVTFDLISCTYKIKCNMQVGVILNKAIQKQIQELGWLGDDK